MRVRKFRGEKAIGAVMLCICTTIGAPLAEAQDYPSRLIRLISPVPPGTGADLAARLLAPEMSKLLGRAVVIENKPGAGHMIAYEYVAKQVPPDGHAIAIVSVTSLVTLPLAVANLRFDPLKDLWPAIGFAEARLLFASTSQMPWKSFGEMLAAAKAYPGKFNYGSSVMVVRLQTETLFQGSGVQVMHVPYSSGASYLQGLASGEIHMGYINQDVAATFGDKMRTLAVTGDQRLASMRDIPTFAELGHPQIRGGFYTLSVPTATPKNIVDKIYGVASHAMQQPEMKARFEKIRHDVLDMRPDAAAARTAEEAAILSQTARALGIKPE